MDGNVKVARFVLENEYDSYILIDFQEHQKKPKNLLQN